MNRAAFVQICMALEYMHRQRVMHRDVKPSNIFVTESGSVKLGDLGLSRVLSSQTLQVHTMVGTPCYMSPEAIRGQVLYCLNGVLFLQS